MKYLFAVAAVLASLASGPAFAVTVFSDNFESYSLGAPSSLSPTWTVTPGNADVIGPGFYDWCGGGQCIDLNGSADGNVPFPNTAAKIAASFAVEAGTKYALTFDYGINQNSPTPGERLEFGVSGLLSGSLLYDYILIGSMNTLVPSFVYAFVATVTESVTLFFQDMDISSGDQGGPLLDNVLVATVPVPGGVALLGGGLAMLGLVAWRKKRAGRPSVAIA